MLGRPVGAGEDLSLLVVEPIAAEVGAVDGADALAGAQVPEEEVAVPPPGHEHIGLVVQEPDCEHAVGVAWLVAWGSRRKWLTIRLVPWCG